MKYEAYRQTVGLIVAGAKLALATVVTAISALTPVFGYSALDDALLSRVLAPHRLHSAESSLAQWCCTVVHQSVLCASATGPDSP